MTEEKDIALVTGYLENQLGPDDKESVEKRLSEEPEFQALFQDLKQLTKGMEHLTHAQLLARIDRLEENLEDPLARKGETKTVFWTFQRLAAAFIGLAVVAFASWYGLSGSGEVDGVALYSEYYVAYDNSVIPIVRADDAETLIERAFHAYELQEYEQANDLFDELLKTDDRLLVKFYAGIAAMEVEESGKATRLLKTVIDQQADFEIQAQWYLALNYLKQKEYDLTIQLLEKLVDTDNSFSPKAKELLKEIR